MRYVWVGLFLFGLAVYALLDSQALEFKSENAATPYGLVDRRTYKPEFHGDRLETWSNNLISKFVSKFIK